MGVSESQGRGGKRACPICSMPAAAAYRPFCSAHCAEVDLGRWLTGRYRIPAVQPPDDFSEASPDGTEEERSEGADEGSPAGADGEKGIG